MRKRRRENTQEEIITPLGRDIYDEHKLMQMRPSQKSPNYLMN